MQLRAMHMTLKRAMNVVDASAHSTAAADGAPAAAAGRVSVCVAASWRFLLHLAGHPETPRPEVQ
jgi:hypothetical protein